MKKFFKVLVWGLLLFTICVGLGTDFNKIYALPEKAYVSRDDIKTLNKESAFGVLSRVSVSDLTVSAQKKTVAKMWVKLFGIIPIRQIEVELSDGEEVYLGGTALGFSIKTDGLMVVGTSSVLGEDGKERPVDGAQIQNGDFLIKINGEEVLSPDEVPEKLKNVSAEKGAVLTFSRGDEEYCTTIYPADDAPSGEKKLGLWVKNTATGIGTLTFVRLSDNSFGALGHAITDFETGAQIPVLSGKIYKTSQVGITKAQKNCPGELRCVFLEGINPKGSIDCNTTSGVFGTVSDPFSLVDNNRTAQIGSRLLVKAGPAKILSSVSGALEEYDIEIIKTYYQPSSDDKSFVFRVTDSRLLELTGGIVQGMSGSPIIQNGKLIGATTHVFVSDPTKGYGIYTDWMTR